MKRLLHQTHRIMVFVFMAMASLLCSCTDAFEKDSHPVVEARRALIDSLSASLSELTSQFRFNEALSLARAVLDSTEYCKDNLARLKALAYAGQTYMMSDFYDSAVPVLDEGMKLWYSMRDEGARIQDHTPVYVLYNSMSIYAVTVEMNYEKAIGILTDILATASSLAWDEDYSILSFNLIFTYYLRNDAEGLPIALEMYSNGRRLGKDQMIFLGAYSAALMYYVKGDYELAEKFVREALESPFLSMSPMGVHNLYANILAATGQKDEALNQYMIAWDYRDIETATTVSNVCLSYGNFLMDNGDPSEAINLFRHGLELNENVNNRVFTYMLFKAISSAYQQLGHWHEALDYYQRYDQEADSLFNIRRERATAALVLQYENAKHETQIQRMKGLIRVIALAVVASLAIIVIMWRMYRHKNQMYTSIVRRYKEELRREKVVVTYDAVEKEHKDSQFSQQGRGGKLFLEIENLMKTDRLYRQPDITRDRLAEIMGTNRTYISKAINENTGKTFNQYISSYRISDVIQSLTDPDCKVSMKVIAIEAGFCSFSTFAKQFKDEVGMTPSKYREKVLELSESDNAVLKDAETTN